MLFATSNAFWDWDGLDYAARMAQVTNFFPPLPPRTSANWPRSFPHRTMRGQTEKKGTRAVPGASFLHEQHVVFQQNTRPYCRSLQ